MTFRASAETGAVLLFGVAATVSGLRSLLVHAGASAPSAGLSALASSSTVGLAGGAAVVLCGELVVSVAEGSGLRRVVRRLPVWFCLVTVVALGVVARGGDLRGDESVLMSLLSAQLVMITLALVPSALAAAAS
jgi:hypothetical protein